MEDSFAAMRTARPVCKIHEGGGNFAPVAKFQGALAEPAIGDQRDGVGDAAVDFDIGDDAFAFGDGIFDAQFARPSMARRTPRTCPAQRWP